MRGFVESLPLLVWMNVEIAPLTSHPSDPASAAANRSRQAFANPASGMERNVAIVTGASRQTYSFAKNFVIGSW